MPKPNQLSFVVPTDARARLERLSAESGRPIAALIREAVIQYLDPIPAPINADSLWSILRDPANWQMFKQIAIEMEGGTQAAPPVVEAAPPQPTWRFRRGDDVAGRNNKPPTSPEDDERPPF